MKPVLLDTHAFLWFVFDDTRLSERAADHIAASSPRLSLISVWEIVIKSQLKKLSLGMPLHVFVEQFVLAGGLGLVQLEVSHLLAYGALPLHHRDPFDRLLVAQALTSHLPLVTADATLARYGIEVIW